MGKLGVLSQSMSQFFAGLGNDLGLEGTAKDWIAVDFRNGSLDYTAECQNPVEDNEITAYEDTFEAVTEFQEGDKRLDRVSVETLDKYTRIAGTLDPFEAVAFGRFPSSRKGRVKWRRLDREKGEAIKKALRNEIEYHGAIQGTLKQIDFEEEHIKVRDIVTGELIRCSFDLSMQEDILKIRPQKGRIIDVAGKLRLLRINNRILGMKIERIRASAPYKKGDLDKFFGCAPELTGDLSTEEYLNQWMNDGQ